MYVGQDATEVIKHFGQQQVSEMMLASDGYITSLDTDNKLAKVMLQPLGIETGWLPIGFIYGIQSLPPEGTGVVVIFEMGNVNVGRILVCDNPSTNPKPLARVGDTVSVNVPGIGICTGTITSGSTIVQAG
jgi:phage gp45-like